jgi:hypothetical protein
VMTMPSKKRSVKFNNLLLRDLNGQ